jgi:glycerol uptake facilitator-like aquaporin
MQKLDYRAMVMEALGVLAINYCSGWSTIMFANKKSNVLAVGLTNMLVLTVMVWTGSAVCGSHYNPAITLGLTLTKKVPILTCITYIASQLVGSLLAAIILKMLVPKTYLDVAKTEKFELGYPHYGSGFFMQSFILEFIGAFMWMYMYYALIIDKRAPKHVYGLAIGGTYGVSTLAFLKISGAALNPARVFGPSILSLDFSGWPIYIGATILGATTAAFIYNILLLKTDIKDEENEAEWD